jgi:hypothetical protein
LGFGRVIDFGHLNITRLAARTGGNSKKVNNMSDKAAKIKEMIEMQKKFIEYEHNNGVDPKDYFKPDAGHELDGYRQKYRDLAMEVVDLAHAEAGSHR